MMSDTAAMSTGVDMQKEDVALPRTESQPPGVDQPNETATLNEPALAADQVGNHGTIEVAAAMTEQQQQVRAATKLSSAFRGFAVRQQRRRQEAAAMEIQRIARGRVTRAQTKTLLERHRLLENATKTRQHRLRRIKALERDLRLYRSIAPHQIFEVERIKKVQCAKMIQRAWRRYKGCPMTRFEAVVDMMLEQQFAQEEQVLKRKQEVMDGLSTVFSHRGTNANSIPSLLPAVDLLRLEALKRRFRAQAEDKNAAVPSSSKYHVFHETQQTAASLLGQYSLSKTMLGRRQEERIQRTARCASLLKQLLNPPPLVAILKGSDGSNSGSSNDGDNQATNTTSATVQDQEAKLAAWLCEPAIAHSSVDLQRAIDCHVQSSSTFEGTNQWWVASIPENIDGPPLDIRELAAQSKKPVDITAQLATRDPGVCALESLWWISFARKRFTMTADDRGPDAAPRFEYIHIDGNEQVQKLAKDTFKLAFSAESTRVQEVQEQIAERQRNMKKLSTALHRSWLRQVAEQRSTGFRAQSTKQKEEAATKIQAAARARLARRRAKAVQAEKRIMQALGSLLNELQDYPRHGVGPHSDPISTPIEALRLKLLGNHT